MKPDIIGIYPGHNATAALLREGRIEACASEERWTSVKNWSGFPAQVMSYFAELGMNPATIESVNLPVEGYLAEGVRMQDVWKGTSLIAVHEGKVEGLHVPGRSGAVLVVAEEGATP